MKKLPILIIWFAFLSPASYADDELAAEIQPILDRMEAIYRDDPNGSRQIFDELWLQSENILYLSEQFVNAFYGFGAVASYWKPSWNTLYGYRELYSNLRATRISSNIALATFDIRYDMHAVTRTPLAGWSRLTLVLRQVDDTWKIQQFYETPMSLLSQGRRIHEEALDPNFTDFARSQNSQYDEMVGGDANIKARKEGVPWAPRPPFRPPTWTSGTDVQQKQPSSE